MESSSQSRRKSVVFSKWIYNIKHSTGASIEKHKARFVTRGFSQKEGINFEKTFYAIKGTLLS